MRWRAARLCSAVETTLELQVEASHPLYGRVPRHHDTAPYFVTSVRGRQTGHRSGSPGSTRDHLSCQQGSRDPKGKEVCVPGVGDPG